MFTGIVTVSKLHRTFIRNVTPQNLKFSGKMNSQAGK